MTLEEAIKHAEENAKCGGKCGEDHAQLAMWLKELQKLRAVETEKRNGKSTQNVPKEDLISRKAAIEALDSINCCGYVEEPWDIVRGIIERVPAAEPEKRTEEHTETHACDCISRRAAIEHLKKRLYETEFNSTAEYSYYQEIADNRVGIWMNEVPSAQPEIVRCGDCKYLKVEHGWNCASYPICEVSPQRIITPDDYCSFAERRTDD